MQCGYAAAGGWAPGADAKRPLDLLLAWSAQGSRERMVASPGAGGAGASASPCPPHLPPATPPNPYHAPLPPGLLRRPPDPR